MDIGVYGARGVPSTYGGFETFLTSMLPELVANGHRVTMYCRQEAGEPDDRAAPMDSWNGVRRVMLPAIAGKNLNTLSHGLVAAIAARRAGHDVVVVFNVANAMFCGLGRWTGQPVVLNTDGQEWRRGKWGRAGRAVFLAAARWARRSANALVTDSSAMDEIYREQFHSCGTVIPYCVPADEALAPGPEGSGASTRRCGFEPGGYVLLAGRHNPENNLHTVAAEYLETDTELPLVVLGTANYDSPVTAALADMAERDTRLVLHGHVDDRSAYFDLLRNASVHVHGHSVGGTNPGLIEAMACGARVLALDNPFNRETLGGSGRFFRLGSGQFGELMRRCVDETADSEARYRAQLRRIAVDRYSLRSIVAAYSEVIVAAAGSGRKGGISLPTRWTRPADPVPTVIDLRHPAAAEPSVGESSVGESSVGELSMGAPTAAQQPA